MKLGSSEKPKLAFDDKLVQASQLLNFITSL